MKIQNEFDAVIMWVDGNDPRHIAKRNRYIEEKEKKTCAFSKTKWRFIDVGEIKYCVFSIRKYAPWIGNIFIVTDDQIPSCLSLNMLTKLRVTIVDHKTIFTDYPDALPTFNNLSISSLLFKIPNLADNFIVFNDDTFLIDNLEKTDFYDNEKVILRGRWIHQSMHIFKFFKRLLKKFVLFEKGIILRMNNNPVVSNSASFVGFPNHCFEAIHAPHNCNRTILKHFFRDNEKKKRLELNVSYKFRSNNQFGAIDIFNHIKIKDKKAIIIDGSDAEMIIPGYGGLKGLKGQREKFDALKRGNHGKKFLCFQDLAFLKQENPEEFQEVIDWLEETIMK